MKKVMALLLCALMLVSGMTVAVGAQEENVLLIAPAPASDVEVMMVNQVDLIAGWRGNGAWKLDDILNDGDPCASCLYTGTLAPLGPMTIIFSAVGLATPSYDITDMSHLEFDFYVSDAAKMQDVRCDLELTSSGKFDDQENSRRGTFADFKGEALTDGWNHIKIPLDTISGGGGLMKAAWNFIRIFNVDQIEAGEGLTLAFDNLAFSGAKKTEAELEADAMDEAEMTPSVHSVPIFGCSDAFGDFVVDTEEKVAGSSSLSLVWNGKMNNLGIAFPPVDATGMDTLEFDLYISDHAFHTDVKFGEGSLEISSSGKPDMGELSWNFDAILRAVSDWKIGWNHVSLPLNIASKTSINDSAEFDISKVSFLRIYWLDGTTSAQNLVFKLDNFRLTDATSAETDAEAETVATLIAEAKALKEEKGSINADTYEAYKERLNNAKAMYASLSANGQAQADTQAVSVLLMGAQKAVSDYEKSLVPDEPEVPVAPSTPDEPDTPDEPVEPDTPAEPDEPTEEPDTPVEPNEPVAPVDNTNTIIIIIIVATVAIVAVIAVVCVVILKKKKA